MMVFSNYDQTHFPKPQCLRHWMALMNVLQIICFVFDELNTVTDALKLHNADVSAEWKYVFSLSDSLIFWEISSLAEREN